MGACAVFRPAHGELFSADTPLHAGVTDVAGTRVYNFDSGGACVNDANAPEWRRCVSLRMGLFRALSTELEEAHAGACTESPLAPPQAVCDGALVDNVNTRSSSGGSGGCGGGGAVVDAAHHSRGSSGGVDDVVDDDDNDGDGTALHIASTTVSSSACVDAVGIATSAADWDRDLAQMHAEWQETRRSAYDVERLNCYDYVVTAANTLGIGGSRREGPWTRRALCAAGWDGVLRGVELHDVLLARVVAAGGTLYHRRVLGKCRFLSLPPDDDNPAGILKAPSIDPSQCALCSMDATAAAVAQWEAVVVAGGNTCSVTTNAHQSGAAGWDLEQGDWVE